MTIDRRSQRTVKIDEEQLDVLHELVLLGLRETDPADREYCAAYDEFVEAAGYPFRIGDQPERIQGLWNEILEEDGQRVHRLQVEDDA